MARKKKRYYGKPSVRHGRPTGKSGGTSIKTDRSKYKPKKKPFYINRYKRSAYLTQIQSVLAYATAFILVLFFIVFIYRAVNYSSKKIIVNASDVAAFNLPYSTFSNLKELSIKYDIPLDEMVTYYALEYKFFPTEPALVEKNQIEQNFIIDYRRIKSNYDDKDVAPYFKLISTLFSEIQYFPIPANFADEDDVSYMYGNSWGAARDYGSDRVHKGTDIVDRENVRGRIPVVSMTDGIVENLGWNEYGGFRAGIRSGSETYYYYAHLESFAPGLEQGSTVRAGDLLGYMGDTGYSKKEGTRGNFVVHLHVGIAPKTTLSKNEFWINPYIFLRNIENTKVDFS